MTTQHSGTPTPRTVETHATQVASLGRIALLGTFGPAAAPHALVRLPQGDTQIVTLGDSVAGSTVTAISADRLVLSRKGTQQILRMPFG